MKLIVVGFCLIFALNIADAQKCYICGIGAEEPFKYSGKNIIGLVHTRKILHNNNNENITTTTSSLDSIVIASCEEFERNTGSLEKYILECPEDYKGCITQVDGKEITRTCDMLPINDCQTANNVTYCYCNGNLCNGQTVPATTTITSKEINKSLMIKSSGGTTTTTTTNTHQRRDNYDSNTDDDEDMMESSGMETTMNFGRNTFGISSSTIKNEGILFDTTITERTNLILTTKTYQQTNTANHLIIPSFFLYIFHFILLK